MGLPPLNYYSSSIASTYPINSSSVHSQSEKQFYSPNLTILLRLTLLMKDKKKGFQQSVIIAESLETSDFKPFRAYYLSLRDIKTTVSTCLVQGNKSTIKETPSPLRCQYPPSFATGISTWTSFQLCPCDRPRSHWKAERAPNRWIAQELLSHQ